MAVLPTNPKEWSIEAEKYGVSATSVHDLLKVTSASKISLAQYYSLRVLWAVHRTLPDASVLGFSKEDFNYRDASDFLNDKCLSWQKYLSHIEDNPGLSSINKIRDVGAFSNVRYCQLHVHNEYRSTAEGTMNSVRSKFSPRHLRSAMPASTQPETPLTRPSKGKDPMRTGSPSDLDPSFNDISLASINSFDPPSPLTPATSETTDPAEYEQIVNFSLILWLQTLTIFHPRIQVGGLKWSVKQLKFSFGEWEARTDGCLRRKKEIMAIVEVKPYVRQSRILQIQEQESAQVSAWIRNFPDAGGWFVMKNGRKYERRLLVSQDSSEIYLTVAEFEPAYKEYVCGKQQSKNPGLSFMTMYQYGPWDTLKVDHMGQLGKLLLAFTLRCHETNVNTLGSDRELSPTRVKPRNFNDDPFESDVELSPPPPLNRKKAYNEKGRLAETTTKPAKPGSSGKLGTTSKTVNPSTSGSNLTSRPPSTSERPKHLTKPSLPLRSGKSRKPDTEDPAPPREPWR